MIIERISEQGLKIHTPAKVNLFLEVLGKRSDGYHELDTIMHSVSLYDVLEIQRCGKELHLQVEGRPAGPNRDNLALKAACLFNARLGAKEGFEIKLDKRIPVGGGLGGGSSDCAAVLVGCNELTGRPFSLKSLKSMAVELGSDVPFFLFCGTARCQGRGEIVSPIPRVHPLAFLIIYPGFSVPTRHVFENLNLDLTELKNNHNLLNALLKSGESATVNGYLFNRLEKSALESVPELNTAWEKARTLCQYPFRVTGSGSSLFQAVAEHEIRENGIEVFRRDRCWEIFLVTSSPMLRL